MNVNEIDTFGTSSLSHFGIGMAAESSSHPHSLNLHEQCFISPPLETKHHWFYSNVKFSKIIEKLKSMHDKYVYNTSDID